MDAHLSWTSATLSRLVPAGADAIYAKFCHPTPSLLAHAWWTTKCSGRKALWKSCSSAIAPEQNIPRSLTRLKPNIVASRLVQQGRPMPATMNTPYKHSDMLTPSLGAPWLWKALMGWWWPFSSTESMSVVNINHMTCTEK